MALPVLSDLDAPWTLGGGTGLFLSLRHRISYDIDIFMEDPRTLKRIAGDPRVRQISDNWQFPGNYLKLVRSEGEIDFILASSITEDCFFAYDFKGLSIRVETPSEIIAKKIRHRGHAVTIRDLFDFASAMEHDPGLIEKLRTTLYQNDFEKTLARVNLLKDNFPSGSLSQFIHIIGTEASLPEIYDIVTKALSAKIRRDHEYANAGH
ncbi:MAG: nucleotidyl transferase AbiEii/AbiGii toxin family protein [Deltaproteobacteria bacterium]|nr:nucleotidyl transferase AbiEii/AbiGii toxin family protein [Deltaproteobacteria bacterium]